MNIVFQPYLDYEIYNNLIIKRACTALASSQAEVSRYPRVLPSIYVVPIAKVSEDDILYKEES
jgi:hypothetical protein